MKVFVGHLSNRRCGCAAKAGVGAEGGGAEGEWRRGRGGGAEGRTNLPINLTATMLHDRYPSLITSLK